MSAGAEEREVTLRVNGAPSALVVPVRETLADTLRDRLRLTGTHLGCEQGVCGSCTVLIDGATARACTTLTVQADGAAIWTVEGLSPRDGLSPLQRRLSEEHGLQCGFCTPGIVVAATELLARAETPPSEDEVRGALSGNLCRCTGYLGIVRAVVAAAREPLHLPDGVDIRPPAASVGAVTAADVERPRAAAVRGADGAPQRRRPTVPRRRVGDAAALVAGVVAGWIARGRGR